MAEIVTILGARGRLGRAAVQAFNTAGWHVRAVARRWAEDEKHPGIDYVECDAFDQQALVQTVQGSSIIVNALIPPYQRWQKELLILTEAVLEAAKAAGATVILAGNVYVYGDLMPEALMADTPHAALNPLGKLRIEMEQMYADAAENGVRTILLRGGDFLEGQRSGNWFDSHMATGLPKKHLVYPGPLNVKHAWAYLPDFARAMVGLAAIRGELNVFEYIGYQGYGLTGQELTRLISEVVGYPLKTKKMPWGIMRFMQLFMPSLRGVIEMSYLWKTSHQIDGAKFEALLPDFRPTPAAQAFEAIVADLFPEMTLEPRNAGYSTQEKRA